MIEKIIYIKNVGVYKDCNPSDSTALEKVTLVYGENKRGKSTLVDILRSVKTGRSDIIGGRTTIGTEEDPYINIRINSNNYRFKQGNWQGEHVSNLAIFDEKFINEHVITGYSITSDHKKKLNSLIVSDKSKELIRDIEKIKEKIKNKNIQMSEVKNLSIKNSEGALYRLEQFLEQFEKEKFNRVSKMDSKELLEHLEKIDKKLKQVKEREEIIKREGLEKAKKLQFNYTEEEIIRVLNRTVNLKSETIDRVSKRIQELCMNGEEERWLREGIRNTGKKICPFCTQNLEPVAPLISELKNYFEDDEYKKKISELTRMIKYFNEVDINRQLSQNNFVAKQNKNNKRFWGNFIDLDNDQPEISYQGILLSLRSLKDYISNKREEPIGRIDEDSEMQIKNFFTKLYKYNETIQGFNKKVDRINTKIKVFKTETEERTDLVQLRKERAFLDFILLVKKEGRIKNIQNFFKLIEEKSELDKYKSKKIDKLNKKVEEDHEKYGEQINKELEFFDSNVSVQNLENMYKGTGTTPFSEYGISLDGNEISLDIQESEFSIMNSLSTSDRRTLALCFFLAKLKVDSSCSDKIIVFDDPSTSYDKHLEDDLCRRLKDIARNSKQLIIFSHNLTFLIKMQKSFSVEKISIKTLKIKRASKTYSEIIEFDIDETMLDEYFEDFRRLERYLDEESEEKVDVARSAIAVLEKFLKIKFPNNFVDKKNLGGMINYLKSESLDPPLKSFRNKELSLLEEINAYFASKKHGEIKEGTIQDTELVGKVEKIINFIYS